MRVGLVTGEYPPLQGGVGAYTRELARALSAQGHAVSVFTRVMDAASTASSADRDTPAVDVTRAVGARWDWRSHRLIAGWLSRCRPDVVNIQFETAAFNMLPAIHWTPRRIRPVPVVTTFHDLRVPYLFPRAGALRTWIVRKLATDSGGVIATDRADERTLREVWGISQVAWIPIGSNVRCAPPDTFERAVWRSSLGVGRDDLLIGYFGFLNESKGGLVLVEALERLTGRQMPAHLLMMGGRTGASDPANVAYGQRVDTLIAQHALHPRVHWTGYLDEAELSAAFLACDVIALPYLDGVSLRRGTLMAALVHGRAIVTTHPQTHAPELDGVVETIPSGDADALAERIAAVWQDGVRRVRLESAARTAAAHFRWEAIAQDSVTFYRSVIQPEGKARLRQW